MARLDAIGSVLQTAGVVSILLGSISVLLTNSAKQHLAAAAARVRTAIAAYGLKGPLQAIASRRVRRITRIYAAAITAIMAFGLWYFRDEYRYFIDFIGFPKVYPGQVYVEVAAFIIAGPLGMIVFERVVLPWVHGTPDARAIVLRFFAAFLATLLAVVLAKTPAILAVGKPDRPVAAEARGLSRTDMIALCQQSPNRTKDACRREYDTQLLERQVLHVEDRLGGPVGVIALHAVVSLLIAPLTLVASCLGCIVLLLAAWLMLRPVASAVLRIAQIGVEMVVGQAIALTMALGVALIALGAALYYLPQWVD